MSDTILGGNFTVYYLSENRKKLVVWTGSATGTNTVNQLYSALAALLDQLNQMDDGSVMSAQTPTAYTIGIIDPSDKDPWFIDRTTVEHLTGGAISTNGWARVTGTNTGIVRITYTGGTNFITSDIGLSVVNGTSSCTGTLLDFATNNGIKYAWIRPTDNTSANDWGGTTGTVTATGGTGSVTQNSAAVSGEFLWANVYNTGIATLVANTDLYIYQNGAKQTAYKGTFSWWAAGTFDVLVLVKDVGTLIDGGFLTVFARQSDQTYAHFITGVSSGGRNPIPLQTGSDLNNQNIGYRTLTGSSGSGTFGLDEIIYAPGGGSLSAATKTAIVTNVAGTGGAPILTYYLIGTLTDFVASDAVKGNTSGATCTSGSPSNTSIVSDTATITFGENDSFDINEDGSTEPYSIVINLQSTYSVLQGYQWTQLLTCRGGVTTGNTNGINGECYIGEDYRMTYTTLTGFIPDGYVVTGLTSAATGTVVALHTSSKILVLRNSRGSFTSGETVQENSTGNNISSVVPTPITPIGAAPFGIFAGGTWFCAPGVVLQNELTSDVNKFQLTCTGATVVAPTKVTVEVSNTRAGDTCGIFVLTGAGGTINKTQYSGTSQSAGATTLVAGTTIATTTPGKTAGGVVRIVKISTQTEYRMRYNSYSGSTFTLATQVGLSGTAGSSSTVLVDSTASFVTWGILVGDLLRNTTEGVIAYVTSVDSQTQLHTTPVSNWNGDAFQINTLPVAMTSSDYIYVPIIDVYETTGTDLAPGNETVSVTYTTNVPVLVRTRQGGTILPFETTATITSSGLNVSVIRTADTIFQ